MWRRLMWDTEVEAEGIPPQAVSVSMLCARCSETVGITGIFSNEALREEGIRWIGKEDETCG